MPGAQLLTEVLALDRVSNYKHRAGLVHHATLALQRARLPRDIAENDT